jgi:hypothetical protein
MRPLLNEMRALMDKKRRLLNKMRALMDKNGVRMERFERFPRLLNLSAAICGHLRPKVQIAEMFRKVPLSDFAEVVRSLRIMIKGEYAGAKICGTCAAKFREGFPKMARKVIFYKG